MIWIVRLLAWYTGKRRGSRPVEPCQCCGHPTASFLCVECEEAFRHLDKAELSRYVKTKRG